MNLMISSVSIDHHHPENGRTVEIEAIDVNDGSPPRQATFTLQLIQDVDPYLVLRDARGHEVGRVFFHPG